MIIYLQQFSYLTRHAQNEPRVRASSIAAPCSASTSKVSLSTPSLSMNRSSPPDGCRRWRTIHQNRLIRGQPRSNTLLPFSLNQKRRVRQANTHKWVLVCLTTHTYFLFLTLTHIILAFDLTLWGFSLLTYHNGTNKHPNCDQKSSLG